LPAARRGGIIRTVPVGCEYTLSRRWSKDAKAIIKDAKVYAWEPPAHDLIAKLKYQEGAVDS
jgi:hypothetical protein